jgi:hypothetical protein
MTEAFTRIPWKEDRGGGSTFRIAYAISTAIAGVSKEKELRPLIAALSLNWFQ